MVRQLLLSCVGGCALTVLAPFTAFADDLPLRKPGLWEMNVVGTNMGKPISVMSIQQCTDETTDRDMSITVSPVAKQLCSKNEVRKTATGYTVDAVCGVAGMSMTSHSDLIGDLNSGYSVTTTSHGEGGPSGLRDIATKIEAKWLGACKEGQRPGDGVMPGGLKFNVKDAEKLKGLLPKAP